VIERHNIIDRATGRAHAKVGVSDSTFPHGGVGVDGSIVRHITLRLLSYNFLLITASSDSAST
jgi:hypothetical protein